MARHFHAIVWQIAVCLVMLGGCESSPKAPLTTPAAQEPDSSVKIRALREEEQRPAAEIADLREKAVEFRRRNPQLLLLDVASAQLLLIGKALTEAELATIDANARYASGHPSLLQAKKREEQLLEKYNATLERFRKISALSADYDLMVAEREHKELLLRHLQERIGEWTASKI